MTIVPLLNRISTYIINPIITLMFAVAALMFLWGLLQFMTSTETDSAREQGKRNILWGIIGMFIMLSVYGIINILLETFGIPSPTVL